MKVDSVAAIVIALTVLVGMAPVTVQVLFKWGKVLGCGFCKLRN